MINITQTWAYWNAFFEKSNHPIDFKGISLLVKEWFPVTQAFCLGLPGYISIIAKEIMGSAGRRREALEKAILVPLVISGGELGMGVSGVNGFHYRMFARLGGPLGLKLDDLHQCPRGTLAETGMLVDGIRETLSDLYLGAGCIRVVEGTAYKIVEAMDRLLRPMKQPNGELLYTEDQLEYITLHLELEKEHDPMAADFIEALCGTPEQRTKVDAGIDQMCQLFGDFWERMAVEVFGNHQLG